MALRLDRADLDKIYQAYVDAYNQEALSGTPLSNMKSPSKVDKYVIDNKQEFKTKTYGQIAYEILQQNINQAKTGETVANFAIELATDDNIEDLNKYIEGMVPGDDKDKVEMFRDDLLKVREGFNNILEHMKDDLYFKNAIDAIWEMTSDSELIHQMYSPDDGTEEGDLFGAIMNRLKKLNSEKKKKKKK